MKVGARARLILVVMIGVMAGVGFISLPSILAVPTAPSTTSPTIRSGTNSTGGTSLYGGSATTQNTNITKIQLSNSTKSRVPVLTTITPDGLSVVISLIVAPALAVSWVATVLVSSRARKVLDISEEESLGESSNGP